MSSSIPFSTLVINWNTESRDFISIPSFRALEADIIFPIPSTTSEVGWLSEGRFLAFSINIAVSLVAGQAKSIEFVIGLAEVTDGLADSIGIKVSSGGTSQANSVSPFSTEIIWGRYEVGFPDTFSLFNYITFITRITIPIVLPSVAEVIHRSADTFRSEIPSFRALDTDSGIPTLATSLVGVDEIDSNTDSINNTIALIAGFADTFLPVENSALGLYFTADSIFIEVIVIGALGANSILPSFASKVVIYDGQKLRIISEVRTNVLGDGEA